MNVTRATAHRRPVLVVEDSDSADPHDLRYCYQVGANAYHVKPVRYEEHLQVLLDLFAYWLTRVTLPLLEAPLR